MDINYKKITFFKNPQGKTIIVTKRLTKIIIIVTKIKKISFSTRCSAKGIKKAFIICQPRNLVVTHGALILGRTYVLREVVWKKKTLFHKFHE